MRRTRENGSPTTLESHLLGYRAANGVYMNGNRVADTYELKGPNTGAPCRPGSECEATYGYDGRDRLSWRPTDGPDGPETAASRPAAAG